MLNPYRSEIDIARLIAIAFLGVLVTHVHAAEGPPSLFERLGKLLSGKEDEVRQPQAHPLTVATGMSTTQQAPVADHQRRVALVIGNNTYRHVAPLDNAIGDARAVAKEFETLGFDVILRTDSDLSGMKAAVKEFSQKVANGGFGAFFYAGHGVADGGNNYLLPVDIPELAEPSALSKQAVEFNGEVMTRLEEVAYSSLDAELHDAGPTSAEVSTKGGGYSFAVKYSAPIADSWRYGLEWRHQNYTYDDVTVPGLGVFKPRERADYILLNVSKAF